MQPKHLRWHLALVVLIASLVLVAGVVAASTEAADSSPSQPMASAQGKLFLPLVRSGARPVPTESATPTPSPTVSPTRTVTPTRTVIPTPTRAGTSNILTVNPSRTVRPFTSHMLGQAFVNWEHAWGKPFIGTVPGSTRAFREAGMGLIRYAGGLWANDVGWDRAKQRTPYTAWVKNGQTYWFHYGTDEIEALHQFAAATGADVMIQVNVSTYDPAMWADMVRYCNIEKGYGFQYWELGNEFDVASDKNVSPDEYARRAAAYIDAMKAVDPSIRIIVGVPGSAHDAPRQGWSDAVTDLSHYITKSAPIVTGQGRRPDGISYHWYQQCNSSSYNDLLRWTYDGLDPNSWRNAFSRKWSFIAPRRIQAEVINPINPALLQGITELNYDACAYENKLNGNHMSALWASDVLGRLAYHGLDFATWYEGYATQGYSIVYPDTDYATRVFVRPSYYAFFMYSKYFGDRLVESASYDETRISIWASTDSRDPNKLKLRITNLTSSPITVPIDLGSFRASTGAVYVLSSTNPTDSSAASNTAAAGTTINGVKIDPMNMDQSLAAIAPTTIVVGGTSFTYTFPAYSSTAIVLSAGGG